MLSVTLKFSLTFDETSEAKEPEYQQGQKELAYQQGQKELAYHQGQKEPAYQQGQKQPAYQQGQKQPAYQQGQKQPTHQQGQKEPTHQQGQKQPTYQQGQKEPAYQQGQKQPTYQQGQKQPTYQQGQKEPAYQQGQKQPTYQQGQKQPTYQQGQKEPAYHQGQKEPAYQQVQKQPTYQQGQKEPAYQQGQKEQGKIPHDPSRLPPKPNKLQQATPRAAAEPVQPVQCKPMPPTQATKRGPMNVMDGKPAQPCGNEKGSDIPKAMAGMALPRTPVAPNPTGTENPYKHAGEQKIHENLNGKPVQPQGYNMILKTETATPTGFIPPFLEGQFIDWRKPVFCTALNAWLLVKDGKMMVQYCKPAPVIKYLVKTKNGVVQQNMHLTPGNQPPAPGTNVTVPGQSINPPAQANTQ